MKSSLVDCVSYDDKEVGMYLQLVPTLLYFVHTTSLIHDRHVIVARVGVGRDGNVPPKCIIMALLVCPSVIRLDAIGPSPNYSCSPAPARTSLFCAVSCAVSCVAVPLFKVANWNL